MPDDADWLLAPVVAGMCKFESLKDGSVDLADVALMNDALACKADNQAIMQKWQEDHHGG